MLTGDTSGQLNPAHPQYCRQKLKASTNPDGTRSIWSNGIPRCHMFQTQPIQLNVLKIVWRTLLSLNFRTEHLGGIVWRPYLVTCQKCKKMILRRAPRSPPKLANHQLSLPNGWPGAISNPRVLRSLPKLPNH